MVELDVCSLAICRRGFRPFKHRRARIIDHPHSRAIRTLLAEAVLRAMGEPTRERNGGAHLWMRARGSPPPSPPRELLVDLLPSKLVILRTKGYREPKKSSKQVGCCGWRGRVLDQPFELFKRERRSPSSSPQRALALERNDFSRKPSKLTI